MTARSRRPKSALRTILSDRPIAYHPCLARISGGATAGILLSQLLYWDGVMAARAEEYDGWFYKSARELQEETGLTRRELLTARARLLEHGLTEERLAGMPAVLHYRIRLEIIEMALQEGPKCPDPDPEDGESLHINNTGQFAQNVQTGLPETCKQVCTKGANKNGGNEQTGLHETCNSYNHEITHETTQEITSPSCAPESKLREGGKEPSGNPSHDRDLESQFQEVVQHYRKGVGGEGDLNVARRYVYPTLQKHGLAKTLILVDELLRSRADFVKSNGWPLRFVSEELYGLQLLAAAEERAAREQGREESRQEQAILHQGFQDFLREHGYDRPDEKSCMSWEHCRVRLERELSETTLRNYVLPIVPLSCTDSCLTIIAPSAFVRDWLTKRFSSMIKRRLSDLFEREATFTVLIPEDLTQKEMKHVA